MNRLITATVFFFVLNFLISRFLIDRSWGYSALTAAVSAVIWYWIMKLFWGLGQKKRGE